MQSIKNKIPNRMRRTEVKMAFRRENTFFDKEIIFTDFPEEFQCNSEDGSGTSATKRRLIFIAMMPVGIAKSI